MMNKENIIFNKRTLSIKEAAEYACREVQSSFQTGRRKYMDQKAFSADDAIPWRKALRRKIVNLIEEEEEDLEKALRQ